MITVVNEPTVEYQVISWRSEAKGFSVEDFICGIKNEKIMYCPPRGTSSLVFYEKPKRKLSSLRGKMTRQSNKEIEQQKLELRSEWDRNI